MSIPDTSAPQILFVDDEPNAVKYFQRTVEKLAPVITASSVEEGKRLLDANAETLAVVISDQRMPGGYGNELLQYARTRYPHMVRILTTAYSELGHTIDAVNQGQIHRYIQKPWDISALTMELRQALEFAALRKEHAQLLREKLMVRQTQTVSSRIGALHALALSLSEPDQPSPLETYLSAAASIGVSTAAPDWLSMDYADLVSAEARRAGQFGRDVRGRLEEIRQSRPDESEQGALALLTRLLGPDAVKVGADGASALFPDAQALVEFLETPSDAAVSAQHAAWLAYLIWLHGIGKSLQAAKTDAGLEMRLCAPTQLTTDRLATWISEVCDTQLGAR
jgi:two-component system probable response regulator PhcQ